MTWLSCLRISSRAAACSSPGRLSDCSNTDSAASAASPAGDIWYRFRTRQKSCTVDTSAVSGCASKFPHATSCCNVPRSEEHTSELQSRFDLVCRLLLEKKKKKK